MIAVLFSTLKGMFLTALTAAVSENLVLVRAFGLGELDYEEFTPARALREGWIVTLMAVLAAVSGWLGRWLISRHFPLLPAHLQPPVFLGIFTVAFLCIMGGIILVRRKKGKETSKKRYKLHTAIAFGFLPLGVLLVTGFGNSALGESMWMALGAGGGYALAMLICWSIRERLDLSDIPRAFRGAPILFIYLGLLSLALFGLVGHQLAL
ncbi:MAG: hypothetical protein HFF11_03690 [Angelakisella sp.]|nr:hypothetical protein [Angelakisella sp.]